MITIGIIDSGIKQNSITQLSNIKGLKFYKDKFGKILTDDIDIYDKNGHGNACFRIINSMAVEANYLIVKIFEEQLTTELDILESAINFCIDNRVDIINISAGFTSEIMPVSLKIICDDAYNKGILIVAAKNNDGMQCFPASYEKVISVGLTYETSTANFGITDFKKNELFLSVDYLSNECDTICTSFACAKMTAIISKHLIAQGKFSLSNLGKEIFTNTSNN